MIPGKRTLNHPWVGHSFRVKGTPKMGMCVSVTPRGNDRIRWVRLALSDGTDKSFAPKDVERVN